MLGNSDSSPLLGWAGVFWADATGSGPSPDVGTPLGVGWPLDCIPMKGTMPLGDTGPGGMASVHKVRLVLQREFGVTPGFPARPSLVEMAEIRRHCLQFLRPSLPSHVVKLVHHS